MENNASERTKCDGDNLFLARPCNYLQEFMRAILKCLGLTNSDPQDSSSSSAADPPSSPAALLAATARARRPPPPSPPSIGGGRGPGTNANPS
ncbi:hypothetical protein ACS0TY_013368 [Phlomoides rotata]